jgi:hypothetical protein
MTRRWLLVLCVLLGLLTVLPAVASAEETDPFLTTEVFPPREVVVPGAAGSGEATLLDALGVSVPLTGAGRVDRGADLVLFPPRLPAGEYTVRHDGGEFRFEVGEPPFTTASPRTATEGFPWLPVLLLVAAAPGFVLALRPGRRVLALPLLGVAAVGGFLLLTGDPGSVSTDKGDPCVAQQSQLLDCASTHVLGVFESEGVAAASEELLRVSTTPGSPWAPICHEVAHTLGELAFRVSRDPAGVIDTGFLDCSLGYVHGALEAMGTYLPDDDLADALVAACGRLDELFLPAGTESILGCHHGAGHAAMWRHNEDLTAARGVCDRFASPRQREECKVGALMEWVYAGQRAAVSGRSVDAPLPRVDSPLELCAPPHGELTPGCVEGALTAVGKDDVADATRWCAENPSVLSACVTSLARRVVQIDLSEGGSFLTDPMSFCGAFTGDAARSECARRLGYMHLFLSRSNKAAEKLCSSFPSGLAASCRDGNREVLEYAESLGDGSFNFRD